MKKRRYRELYGNQGNKKKKKNKNKDRIQEIEKKVKEIEESGKEKKGLIFFEKTIKKKASEKNDA